jgi:hypothetical protein
MPELNTPNKLSNFLKTQAKEHGLEPTSGWGASAPPEALEGKQECQNENQQEKENQEPNQELPADTSLLYNPGIKF